MGQVEKEDDDIDKHNLSFLVDNRENFNFNIFRMPLRFLSAIYNSEITLKRQFFFQKDLNDQIEVASEVDKRKSEPKPEESIAKRVHL